MNTAHFVFPCNFKTCKAVTVTPPDSYQDFPELNI